MPNYTFETLNDKDFEDLVRDLLQKELGITLESFKRGRDSGIDLRYSKPKVLKSDVIIQAKHWYNSGVSKFINYLEKTEFEKVKALNPNRYILATSLSLTPNNKSKLIDIFKPFIISTSDIVDSELLNNLLGKYPDVEKSHYKLWLSSTSILQSIINNSIKGRSEFFEQKIKERISKFVPTKTYKKAINIINDKKLLIIIGEPGIGKTIMSQFIIYEHLADGFELVVINENVNEAEELFLPDKQQIFYFDDFLGSNYLEILRTQNSDSALINFIDRITSSKGKRLILTSRTTILNKGCQLSDKLQDKRIDLSKYEISINDYDNLEKAKILYNHLCFSKLPNEYRYKIHADKFYWQIIKHKNYNPRLIEFITDSSNAQNVEPEKYTEFILHTLNHPSLIWEHAYENQIDDYCKFLLLTLFSFPTGIESCFLQPAYNCRLEYEIKENGFKRIHNPFFSKVKELQDGFIRHLRNTDGDEYYDFFNPSIVDFLVNYLKKYPDEKWRIIESTVYFEQISTRFSFITGENIIIEEDENERLYKIIKSKENTFKSVKGGSDTLHLINIYLKFFQINNVVTDLLSQFKCLKLGEIIDSQFKQFYDMILDFKNIEILKKEVVKNWEAVILKLFSMAWDKDEFRSIKSLFIEYSISFDDFIRDKKDEVELYIDQFLDSWIGEFFETDPELNSYYELEDMREYIAGVQSELLSFNNDFGLRETSSFGKFNTYDYDDKLNENRQRAEYEDYQANMHEDYWSSSGSTYSDISAIDDLFSINDTNC